MAAAAPQARTITLLDYDPELGRSLDEPRLAEARARALVTMVSLPRGNWNVQALAARCPYGVLLLDGLVSREVVLSDTVSMQLLGRGDLMQASAHPGEGFVDVDVIWHVLEPTSIALLDERFLAAVRRWPEIVAALFERLAAQAARMGTQCALCQLPRVEDRIQALLWFLAERWGRVTSQGVVVPLRLTHDAIGRLVGAKRPTVSLAVKLLDERGAVHRRADGAWLLGEPLEAGAGRPVASTPNAAGFVAHKAAPDVPPPPAPERLTVVPGGDQPGLAPDGPDTVPVLFQRIERMRGVYRIAQRDCRDAISRAVDTRARSAELRARIRANSGRD